MGRNVYGCPLGIPEGVIDATKAVSGTLTYLHFSHNQALRVSALFPRLRPLNRKSCYIRR